MNYERTTQVPNCVFDLHLPLLSEVELKVLLVIIRQTYGWVDKNTKMRKTRDRITSRQFQAKTGYGRRMVTQALSLLCSKKIVSVTDYKGSELLFACDRKGKSYLYYSLSLSALCADLSCATSRAAPAQDSAHNKTKYQKRNGTLQSSSAVLGRRIYNGNGTQKA